MVHQYNDKMAKLPDETTTTIFNLQRQLLERIDMAAGSEVSSPTLADEATATEALLFEEFGETEETIPELQELQSVRERATSSYSRLYTLLLRVAEAQPVASSATLNLLVQAIEQAQANNAAADASVKDVKRNWNLP